MELARRSARVATAPKGSEFTLGAACHQRCHRPAPACSDRSGDFGDFDGQGLISLGGRGAVRSRGGGDRRAARGTMRRVCQAREPRDQARSVAPGNAADGLVHGRRAAGFVSILRIRVRGGCRALHLSGLVGSDGGAQRGGCCVARLAATTVWGHAVACVLLRSRNPSR